MAKGNDNGKTKKTHKFKPYDTNNSSFVKRITTRVTEILPQPSSWITKWLSPAPRVDLRNDSDEEDEEEDQPAKRLCLTQSNEYTRQLNHVGITDSVDLSPILSNRIEEDRAIPGPSGLQLSRKQNFVFSTPAATQTPPDNIPKVNGDDASDSSESTSGCSSLVPQGEKVSTNTFANIVPKRRPPLHSTPKMMSSSPTSPSQRSIQPRSSKYRKIDLDTTRGRPTFDSFVFSNPLNKSVNVSNLSQHSNLDHSTSPFYKGRTMYGGASSCKDILNSSLLSPRLATPKVVSVKPAATPEASRDRIGTSAMRILKALEQFSAPTVDPKKTPLKSESERRKRKLARPYEELVIPQMPDLLRIKRKERTTTQPKMSTSVSNARVTSSSPLPPPLKSYSLREENTEDDSYVRCIKGKINENLEMQRVEPVNLPDIQLPITSLPKFTMPSLPKGPTLLFTGPPPTLPSSSIVPQSKPRQSVTYKFSEPFVESSKGHLASSIKPSIKFSEPLDESSLNENLNSKNKTSQFTNKSATTVPPSFMISTSSSVKLKEKTKEKEETITDGQINIKPPSKFVKGSVMDCLTNSKSLLTHIKRPEGSWSCDTCLVNNTVDKIKCVACETPKPSKNDQKDSSTETTAASNDNKWACIKCKLSNSETDKNCKCCGADRSGFNTLSTPLAKGLQEFMKAKAETWECKECFVGNKISDTTCVACSTPKPGTVADKPVSIGITKPVETVPTPTGGPSLNSLFKKSAGTWDCDTCLISNKSDVDTCVACGTPKPGAAPSKPSSNFSFGIPAQSPNNNKGALTPGGFTFGTLPVSENKEGTAKPVISGFTFGIPIETEKSAAKSDIFGGSPKKKESEPTLKLRSSALNNTDKDQNDQTKQSSLQPTNIFSFAKLPNETKTESPAAPEQNEDKPKKKVSFGEPLVEEKTISSDANVNSSSSIFSFGSNAALTKTETTPNVPKFSFTSSNAIFNSASTTSGAVNSTETSSTSMFSFGSSSTVSSSTEALPATATTLAPSALTKPSYAFISSNSGTSASKESNEKKDNPPVFGGFSENKTNLFGGSTLTTETKQTGPRFSFGGSATNSFPATDNSANKESNLFGSKKVEPLFSGSTTIPENKDSVKLVFQSKKSDTSEKPIFGSSSEPTKDSSSVVFKLGKTDSVFTCPPFPKESGTSSLFGMKKVNSLAPQEQDKDIISNVFAHKPNANETVAAFSAPTQSKDENKTSTIAFGTSKPNIFNSLNDNKNMFNKKVDNIWQPKFETNNTFEIKPPTGGFTLGGFGSPSILGNNTENKTFPFNEPPKFGVQLQAEAFNEPPKFGVQPHMFAFGASHPEPQQTQPMFRYPEVAEVPTGNAGGSFAFGSQNSITNQAPVVPPTFDPNIKPNFNFSGGATPSFSAAPSSAPEKEPRKIRKAIRRTR